ncbi:MAG: WXG100 family type VII secretion target [Lachnospiraceae bacterium]|nr:WXG100 family type VII secretion target [Lachnospiraceae bacterium]
MAIVLKVDPKVLSEMADDMGQRLGVIRSQFDSVEESVGQMGAYWEGEAYEFHQSQYAALKAAMDEAVNRLRNHPVNLLQMAGLYDRTESDAEMAAQSLLTDVII